jgi:hypothetical protein
MKKIWIFKTPGAESIWYDEPMNMDWSCCSKKQYISVDDLTAYLKQRIDYLVTKTLENGSMGVMVEPDVSLYNSLNAILSEIEKNK